MALGGQPGDAWGGARCCISTDILALGKRRKGGTEPL